MAGRAVPLIPHRSENPDEAALPADCRKILAIVRAAKGAVRYDGPVQVRAVGEEGAGEQRVGLGTEEGAPGLLGGAPRCGR